MAWPCRIQLPTQQPYVQVWMHPDLKESFVFILCSLHDLVLYGCSIEEEIKIAYCVSDLLKLLLKKLCDKLVPFVDNMLPVFDRVVETLKVEARFSFDILTCTADCKKIMNCHYPGVHH